MKMNEELQQLLKNLRLRRILDIYDEQLRAADKEDVSYTEFVTRLMRAQWHARQEQALEWRIRNAKLPERWSLDTFPFQRQPGVNRNRSAPSLNSSSLPRRRTSCLSDRPALVRPDWLPGFCSKPCRTATAASSSKRRISSTTCTRRWRTAHRVYSSDAWRVWMFCSLTSWVTSISNRNNPNIFFKLMEERYRRKPTIVTTNLIYDEWAGFLGNRNMVDALLSRIRHHCHTVRIDGPSLRDPQS